jgi:hypothetical protein
VEIYLFFLFFFEFIGVFSLTEKDLGSFLPFASLGETLSQLKVWGRVDIINWIVI